MKILQTVKYYYPSKGGMQSVVKNIIDGIFVVDLNTKFTVYANSDFASYKKKIEIQENAVVITEFTPFLFKSQPLNFKYSNLQKLIEENDIIHHHYPFPNMELALLKNLKNLKNKTLIVTWHANIKNSRWSFIKKIYDPIIVKILSVAKYIVVTSPQLFENSDILQPFKDKVRIIPLSFDPYYNSSSSFVNNPKIRNLNNPGKILFVGRLRAYKGISYLIEAIQHIRCSLTIIGEGEEEASLKEKAKKLGISNKVFFQTNVDNHHLDQVYRDSDLFVLPSINEAEAFGVVQLEAMAHGLPVINTNLNSGVPYVSVDKISGITVNPKNVEELKRAINTILNDKQLYEKYSKNSLERSKLFTREKLVQSYMMLYQT